MSGRQKSSIVSIIVKIDNPGKVFTEELMDAGEKQQFIYLDRFLYGIPEMVSEGEDGSLLVCIVPSPELLDPWAVTQDLKDAVEEEFEQDGRFEDDSEIM